MTVGLPPGLGGPGAPPPGPPPARIYVDQVSGNKLEVLTQEERAFFESIRDRYLAENHYTAVTDMQDLDRLLVLELLVHRWSNWLASGRDYFGSLVDEKELSRGLKDYSTQITAVKNSMGLSKEARDKEQHESVGAYITELKQRGKQFAVHRSRQAAKAIALMQEAKSLAGTYRRSNDVERAKLGLTAEDIVDWIVDQAGPEFDKIDAEFRANNQRYWTIG